MSNVSAGTWLPAMVRSVEASVRHHTQDGGHLGEQFTVNCSQGWLTYLVSVKMAYKISRFSDVEGLAKAYFDSWKSGKICCTPENCFSKRL